MIINVLFSPGIIVCRRQLGIRQAVKWARQCRGKVQASLRLESTNQFPHWFSANRVLSCVQMMQQTVDLSPIGSGMTCRALWSLDMTSFIKSFSKSAEACHGLGRRLSNRCLKYQGQCRDLLKLWPNRRQGIKRILYVLFCILQRRSVTCV